MSNKLFAGIDIGGTTAKIGLVDENGNIVVKTQAKTEKNAHWQAIMNAYIDPIVQWKNEGKEIAGVGVGGPGAFDKNRRVLKTCVNIPPLQNEPIIEYIEQRLNVPAYGDNDATCAAVGEHIFGAGKDFENFVMLTIGTGVGGGIVLNDKVYRGRDGFAGELGHVVAVPGGHLCGCGNRGCIEAYSSATAIINEVRNGIARGSITSYEGIAPETINAQIIFDKAKAGDAASIHAVDNAAAHLGTVIGSFINMLNLDAVIIGGGVAMAGNFFLDKIAFHTKQIAWPLFMENLPILPAKLQNDAGIIGAASLILEEEK